MSVTIADPFSKNMPANAGAATKISAMECHCSGASSLSSFVVVFLREVVRSRSMESVSTEVRENWIDFQHSTVLTQAACMFPPCDLPVATAVSATVVPLTTFFENQCRSRCLLLSAPMAGSSVAAMARWFCCGLPPPIW